MKKQTMVGLAALLGLALLSSSGAIVAQAKAETVNLTFVGWGDPSERKVFQELTDKFNSSHPGIHVQYTQIPQNYWTKVQTMIAGGDAPDIMYVPDGNFPAFVRTGELVDIQKYVNAGIGGFKQSQVWSSALGRYRYNGKTLGVGDLYALPKDIGPTVLYINENDFAKAHVPLPDPTKPMTFKQALVMWQKLTLDDKGHNALDPKFDPNHIVQFGVGGTMYEDFVWNNGGQILSKDGRKWVLPDDKKSVEALQFIADLALKYHVAPTLKQQASQNVGQMFQTGKAATEYNGRWQTTQYRTLPFKWDVRPLPSNLPHGAWTGWSGSVGLGITKQCKDPSAAYQFLAFIAGSTGQSIQASLGFAVPLEPKIANSKVFLQPGQEPADAKIFLYAAEHEPAGPWTHTPNTQWLDNAWWAKINDLWSGKVTAAEYTKQIQPLVQKYLDSAWAGH